KSRFGGERPTAVLARVGMDQGADVQGDRSVVAAGRNQCAQLPVDELEPSVPAERGKLLSGHRPALGADRHGDHATNATLGAGRTPATRRLAEVLAGATRAARVDPAERAACRR